MIEYLVPDMPTLEQITPYLKEIDRKRWYSNFGPLESRLRQRTADCFFEGCDARNVATSSSGTSAICLTLKALKEKRDGYVLLPSYTFPGTISAIIDAGFKPIFCDVDSFRWKMESKHVERYLGRFPIAAVLPVAAFGTPVDTRDWSQFQSQHNIPVIVDAAAALGQQELDDLTLCFSLHATKIIGAGEGGLIVSKDTDLIKQVRQISNFGYGDGEVITCGSNFKLSEYHAGVALAQYDRIDYLFETRKNLYSMYKTALASIQEEFGVVLQSIPNNASPSSFVIRFPYEIARSVCDKLMEQGVQTRQLYCPALHQHSGLVSEGTWYPNSLEVSEQLGSCTLALPFHNFLSKSDIKVVAKQLHCVLSSMCSPKVAQG